MRPGTARASRWGTGSGTGCASGWDAVRDRVRDPVADGVAEPVGVWVADRLGEAVAAGADRRERGSLHLRMNATGVPKKLRIERAVGRCGTASFHS